MTWAHAEDREGGLAAGGVAGMRDDGPGRSEVQPGPAGHVGSLDWLPRPMGGQPQQLGCHPIGKRKPHLKGLNRKGLWGFISDILLTLLLSGFSG